MGHSSLVFSFFTHSESANKFSRITSSVDDRMIITGWLLVELTGGDAFYLFVDRNRGESDGFLINSDKVEKAYNGLKERSTEKEVYFKTIDLDPGSRFEGLVLTENEKEGSSEIPFGYGEMYDDDGFLVYKGITINWKRFGYGTSYHNNGAVEYEGYWCDDNRFGSGKVYDRSGKLIKECKWYYGIECDTDEKYEGDGSKPINIGIKHLKLINNCVLCNWDVSWFLNLESIEIGNECFGSVQTFRIDGLNQLKTIKIGKNSFTQEKDNYGNNSKKSFHILNCESLESIEIGEYSFSDFAGDFELKNLPQLQFIKFGNYGYDCYNFYNSSFVISGRTMEIH